jgi:cell division protein FtsX
MALVVRVSSVQPGHRFRARMTTPGESLPRRTKSAFSRTAQGCVRQSVTLVRQTLGMLGGRGSVPMARIWAAALLSVALIAVLAAILALRADTQGAVARWSGGRDIHLYLQPEVTASEAHTLQDEVASANGVRSVRVAALPGWVEVRQEVFFSGYSLLPCCTRQISTPGYLDVVATSPSQVNHVEADVQGWEGVLPVTDSRSLVRAKLDSYRRWRDFAVGASLTIMAAMAVLILRRQRSLEVAP